MAFHSKYVTDKIHSYVQNSNPRNQRVKGVVIHHCAGFWGPSVNHLRNNMGSSAHYIIDHKRVGEIIPPERAAWHAANSYMNHCTIGIEHCNSTAGPDWLVADETLETSAKLLAEISFHYDLGLYVHGKNIWMHKEVSQLGTSCPGPYLSRRFFDLIHMANLIISKGDAVEECKSAIPSSERSFHGRVRILPVPGNYLNIRREPKKDAEIIGKYDEGTEVEVTSVHGEWYKTKDGYVHGKYVSVKDYRVRVVVNSSLNLRSGPSTNYSIIGHLYNGQEFNVQRFDGKWGNVRVNGNTFGWIHLDWTEKV